MVPTSIYVNPKFKSAHINPNFLPKNVLQQSNVKIHVNPNFLSQKTQISQSLPIPISINKAPIITNTRRKLVRQSNNPPPVLSKTTFPKNSLIKIGNTKLIRVSDIQKQNPTITSKPPVSVTNKYKIVRSSSDIIRRRLITKNLFISTSKYSLRRNTLLNETLTPKKVLVTDKKLMRM